MLTSPTAYCLGFEHGAEMARDSGSADPGHEGWDGMLITADPRFAARDLGYGFETGADTHGLLAEYARGCQDGADAEVESRRLASMLTGGPQPGGS